MEDTGLPCLRLTAPRLRHAVGRGSPCSGCCILGCFGWGSPTSGRGPCLKFRSHCRPSAMLPFLPLKAMRCEHALAIENKTALFLLLTLSQKQHGSFIFNSHLINKTIPSLGWPCRGSLAGAPSGPHNGQGRPLKQRQPGTRQEEPGQNPWACPGLTPVSERSVPLLRPGEKLRWVGERACPKMDISPDSSHALWSAQTGARMLVKAHILSTVSLDNSGLEVLWKKRCCFPRLLCISSQRSGRNWKQVK